jgi:hypothetical protein
MHHLFQHGNLRDFLDDRLQDKSKSRVHEEALWWVPHKHRKCDISKGLLRDLRQWHCIMVGLSHQAITDNAIRHVMETATHKVKKCVRWKIVPSFQTYPPLHSGGGLLQGSVCRWKDDKEIL